MVTVSPTVMRMVPDRVRREHRIVPVDYRDGKVTMIGERVGAEATDNAIIDATGFRPRWLIAAPEEIARALNEVGPVDPAKESAHGATFDAEYLLHHGL